MRKQMAFWLIVLGSVFAAAIACGIYLVTRILKFNALKTLLEVNRTGAVLAAVAALAVPVIIAVLLMGMMNTMICVIHLAIFWVVCDLVAWIFKYSGRIYTAGICAIAFTVIYLALAWILAHSIGQTEYSLETAKDIGSVRVVQLADAHIGTTFDAKGFARAVDRIAAVNPDIVVITGDFVDDSTTAEDFTGCCEALKSLSPTYGIYYVFGNHDKSFKSSMLNAAGDVLIVNELEKSGVHVLEDESVLIDNRICLIGRQDYSVSGRGAGRASVEKLTENADFSKYLIVLDHQPREYEAEEAAGVDLVLSGHTHGGQMLPLSPLVRLLGSNDLVYGHEKRGNTEFIVTSGISDWEIKFKTGCRSEYVVIDVNQVK